MNQKENGDLQQRFHQNSGFTLVELVTTIIVIAILAVVVLPRLLTQSSYSAYTLQDEFIAELRKTQMMALNNTDRCYRVNVTSSGYQTLHYASRDSSNVCQGTLHRSDELQSLPQNTALIFKSTNSADFSIDFDALGRAYPACSGDCIEVAGSETLMIAIESEGFIHEG